MFDFAELDTDEKANAGVPMVVRHPTTREPLLDKAGEPVTITLLGSDAGLVKRAIRDALDGANLPGLDRDGRKNRATAGRLKVLATATKTWSGVGLDNDELPFSAENARRLYERLAWLCEDADAFIGNPANYYRGPAEPKASD